MKLGLHENFDSGAVLADGCNSDSDAVGVAVSQRHEAGVDILRDGCLSDCGSDLCAVNSATSADTRRCGASSFAEFRRLAGLSLNLGPMDGSVWTFLFSARAACPWVALQKV
jgi:hypothetical protein